MQRNQCLRWFINVFVVLMHVLMYCAMCSIHSFVRMVRRLWSSFNVRNEQFGYLSLCFRLISDINGNMFAVRWFLFAKWFFIWKSGLNWCPSKHHHFLHLILASKCHQIATIKSISNAESCEFRSLKIENNAANFLSLISIDPGKKLHRNVDCFISFNLIHGWKWLI